MPSRVVWELEHDPEQWLVRILEVRSYVRTKQMVDRANSESDLPDTPLVNEAIERRLEAGREVMLRKLEEAKARKLKHG